MKIFNKFEGLTNDFIESIGLLSEILAMLATRRRSDYLATTQFCEDREIKFDIPHIESRLCNGEQILATIDHIDDSKGNPGDTGRMIATNLRIIWYSVTHKKFNLSIGYARIITLNTRTVFSKIKGTSQALYILGAGDVVRFEFLFTDMSNGNNTRNIFNPIFDIHEIYQKSFLYRELKLRSSILRSRQLILLPHEQIYRSLNGVWNLSSDQGNLGSFIVTNIRIVWYADINESFNISLPYMQISSIRIRDSKYGDALVIQTTDTGGGYVLGFRIDPLESLNEIFKELIALFGVYSKKPYFGVYYDSETSVLSKEKNQSEFDMDEFQEINIGQEKEINSKLTSYLAEGYATHTVRRQAIYSKEMGFAIEQLRDGYTLSDLWEITLPKSYQTQ